METNNHGRTVLIVDDDEDLLIIIQHALVTEGFDPICSPNGANMSSIIARRHPDVILLDIHMHGRDGIAICEALKKDPITASTPIIMFSGNENIQALSKACGADDYLAKPFTSDQFRETFRRVLMLNA